MAKVMKLLEGLEGKGIKLNTTSLARYTAENGVLVTVSCSRRRGRVTLPPKLLGLRPEKWDDGTKSFYSDHISMGQLVMIPKEMETELSNLEGQARRLVCSYTLNGTYMPIAQYSEFKEQFEEIREEYFKAINAVADQWDEIRATFITGVKNFVDRRAKKTMLKSDREKMVEMIIQGIPTASDYRKAAKLTVEVRVFPTTATADGLAPDMQDMVNQTWRDDVVANVVRSIETSLGEIFAKVCQITAGYQSRGRINPKALRSLDRIAARVKKMNLFDNPMLESLSTNLGGMADLDDQAAENKLEEALIDIWAYANSTGINLDMSICPFDSDTLNVMLSLRTVA